MRKGSALTQHLCVTGASHRVKCWFWASLFSLPWSLFPSVFGAALLSAVSCSSRLLPCSARSSATEQHPYTGAVPTLALCRTFLTWKQQKSEGRARLRSWRNVLFPSELFPLSEPFKICPIKGALQRTSDKTPCHLPPQILSARGVSLHVECVVLMMSFYLVYFPYFQQFVAHRVCVMVLIFIL